MKLEQILKCRNIVFANYGDKTINKDILISIWYGNLYKDDNGVYHTSRKGDLITSPESTPIHEKVEIEFKLTADYKIIDMSEYESK